MQILDINKRGIIVDFSWLSDLEMILKRKFKIKKSISIALISPAEIQELNKVYRKKNKITDVLSFTIDTEEILGEVVICLDKAKMQAKENKKTIKEELQLLTVHGILHLLGYDHEKSVKEKTRQEKKEQEILKVLNK